MVHNKKGVNPMFSKKKKSGGQTLLKGAFYIFGVGLFYTAGRIASSFGYEIARDLLEGRRLKKFIDRELG